MSDTALLVAACRALEFDCDDGFVRDPFAARLAGERGAAMLRALPRPEMMRFGIAVRSRFIDELLLEALAGEGVATVVSVGCGLDTRPWRLELPADLRWIEVDFADMLDYKEGLMAGEAPHCRRERLTADVTDPAQRRALYEAVGAAPALMITEGLLMYLPASTVEGLASEAAKESGVRNWIADITTSAFAKMLGTDFLSSVRHVQASDSLMGEAILDAAYRNGWNTVARRSYVTDMAFAMDRIRRMMGDRPQPPGPPPFGPEEPTGVHRFGRE